MFVGDGDGSASASATAVIIDRIEGVGRKAHGLVRWGRGLLLLDSERGALAWLDPVAREVTELWRVRFCLARAAPMLAMNSPTAPTACAT